MNDEDDKDPPTKDEDPRGKTARDLFSKPGQRDLLQKGLESLRERKGVYQKLHKR